MSDIDARKADLLEKVQSILTERSSPTRAPQARYFAQAFLRRVPAEDLRKVSPATAAAVIGSVVGGRLVSHVSQPRLRLGFGWFVAAMSVVVLVQEAPADLRSAVLASPVAWAVLGLTALGAVVVAVRRAGSGSDQPDGRPRASETVGRTG